MALILVFFITKTDLSCLDISCKYFRYTLLEVLKNTGAEIEYVKKIKSYRFKRQKVKIDFSLSLIEETEIKKI